MKKYAYFEYVFKSIIQYIIYQTNFLKQHLSKQKKKRIFISQMYRLDRVLINEQIYKDIYTKERQNCKILLLQD